MDKILLQLERLQRHYDHAVKNYDQIALLDLSHTLRIWADLKQTLPTIEPRFASTLAFKSAIAPKKVMRAATGSEFVFAYMPDGVVTYASAGQLCQVPGHNEDFTISASVMPKDDGSIMLKNFCAMKGRALDHEMVQIMAGADVTRGNYVTWMGSEAARVSYAVDDSGKLEKVSLSREMIIRRVANTMDASHPSGAAPVDGDGNRFDPAVQYLRQFKVGGVELAYFILLKVAQDLLHIAPRLLAGKKFDQ